MNTTVIIPVYNSSETLRECLSSVSTSTVKPSEIIVVDDGSTDSSASIAGEFPVKIINLHENRGSGYARNTAAKAASGEILFFIDADVAIEENTLDLALDCLNKNPEADAVIGLFSKKHPNKNFFSQYKNLYMYFTFSKIAGYVDFIFTSICAVKKRAYLDFSETRLKADDTEAGQRYKKNASKIILSRELQVTHLKPYTLLSFIKNDFIVTHDWARIFLKYNGMRHIMKHGGFAHARLNQIFSIMICPLPAIATLIPYPKSEKINLILIVLGIFVLLNLPFFLFLRKEKGMAFMLKSIATTYLDMLVMGAGIIYGTLVYIFLHDKRIR